MADDIDIEEHDILLNPRMKGYLSALAIKNEPEDDHEASCDNDTNYVSENTMDSSDYELSKIATKQSQSFTAYDQAKREHIESAFVLIEDWSDRLKSSNCFCTECRILFATRNALDAHNMSAHSFLVAMEDGEELKHTEEELKDNEEELKQTEEELKHSKEELKPKGIPCAHCDNYFECEEALIKHMYEVIEQNDKVKTSSKATSNKSASSKNSNESTISKISNKTTSSKTISNKAVKHTSKKSEPAVSKSVRISVSLEAKKERKSELNKSEVDGNKVEYVYNCPVCTFALKNINNMIAHVSEKHSLGQEEFDLTPFRPGCTICNKSTTMKTHNHHIKHNHTEEYSTIVSKNKKYAENSKKQNKTFLSDAESLEDNSTQDSNVKKYAKASNNQNETLLPEAQSSKTLLPNRKLTKHYSGKEALYKCVECETEYINVGSAYFHNRTYHPTRKTLVYIGNGGKKKDESTTPQYKEVVPKNVIYRCPICSIHFLNCVVLLCHNIVHKNDKKSPSQIVTWKCERCNKKFRKTDRESHETQHEMCEKIRCFDLNKDLYSRVLCKCPKCNIFMVERQFLKHHKSGCNDVESEHCGICKIRVTDFSEHRKKHKILKSKFIIIDEFIYNNEFSHETSEAKDVESDSEADFDSEVTKFDSDVESNKSKRLTKVDSDVESIKSKRMTKVDSDVESNKSKRMTKVGSDVESTKSKRMTKVDSDVESNKSRRLTKVDSDAESVKSKRKIPLDSQVKAKKAKLDDDDEEVILYKCDACELTTDSYDDVVSHCQQHIIIDNYRTNMKECKICHMKFDKECLNKHGESVKILVYKYLDLLKDSWYDMFTCLSSDKIDDIVSNTKYVTRAIVMYVILDGQPKLTMYKCESCKNYVDPSSVYEHTHSCNGVPGNFACHSCGIKLSTQECLQRHKVIHKDTEITANSYRIVAFNNESGKDVNMKLKKFYDNSRVADDFESDDISDENESKSKEAEVKFFKCTKCGSASVNLHFFYKHTCLKKLFSRKCPKCGIMTSSNALQSHLRWHSENPNIKKRDIIFIPFSNGKIQDGTTKSYAYYQCYICKVMLLNKKHECGRNDNIKCRKCDYMFPVKGWKFHRQKHMEDKSLTRENIAAVVINQPGETEDAETKEALYKCASCKCIFANKQDFCRHYRRNQCYFNSGRKCSDCGMFFHYKAMEVHKQSHKNGVEDNIITLLKSGIKSYTLFRCDRCDIHFLNRATYRLHISRSHKNCGSEACDHCGLNISKVSLEEHIIIHHVKENYKVDDFNIVCPKIEGDSKPNSNAVRTSNRPKAARKVVESEDDDIDEESDSESGDSAKEGGGGKNNKSADAKSVVYAGREYDNTLYLCTCGVHFLKYSALWDHNRAPCNAKNRVKNAKCSECNYLFTSMTLQRHETVHHEMMKLSAKDFVVRSKPKKGKIKGKPCVEKSQTIVPLKRPNRIYKCVKCDFCFLTYNAVKFHIKRKHRSRIKLQKCNICSLKFTKYTLRRHKRLHHNKYKYKLKDLRISEISDKDILSDTEMDDKSQEGTIPSDSEIDDQTQTELDTAEDMSEGEENMSEEDDETADLAKLDESTDEIMLTDDKQDKIDATVTENKRANSKDDSIAAASTGKNASTIGFEKDVGNSSLDDMTNSPLSKEIRNGKPNLDNVNDNVNVSIETKAIEAKEKAKEGEVKLYKCGDCNVYFIDETSCSEHVETHVPLDPYDYIECKLCSLQFQIEFLKKHIQKHHTNKEFCLDKLLVEEFKPSASKTETYYAIDKVQSLLVSTTTDDKETKRVDATSNDVENIVPEVTEKNNSISTSNDKLNSVKETGNKQENNENPEKDESALQIHDTKAIENATIDASQINANIETQDVKTNVCQKEKDGSTSRSVSIDKYNCRFCPEILNNIGEKELHEIEAHLDTVKDSSSL